MNINSSNTVSLHDTFVPDHSRKINAFNRRVPVGSAVAYFEGGNRQGEPHVGRTRSRAWFLINTPVVLIEGKAGAVPIDHVDLLERGDLQRDAAGYLEQMTEALEKMPPIDLELSPIEAWIVFAHLQLALRHPSSNQQASAIARSIAANLQAHFPPEARRIMDLGWDESQDCKSRLVRWDD